MPDAHQQRFPTGERTLWTTFEERATATPDRSFLVFEAADGDVQELTYAAMAQRIRRCARGLADAGVRDGDRVAVQLRNSPEIVVAFFALAYLGAVFVPSNTANITPEIRYLLEVSGARLVITEPAFLDVVSAACDDGHTIIIARGTHAELPSFADLEAATAEPPAPVVDPLALAELIFTSGTTSNPKGVMLTHANCLRAGQDSVHVLWLQEGERCITALPLFHVNAQAMSLFAALTVGGTLVLIEEFRASRFWQQVRHHRATQTAIVAMQLRVLLAQPPSEDDSDHHLRRVFYAINVSTADKEEFERRFAVSLINGYGLSETMTLATASPVVGDRRWPSIGLPSPGRILRLVDDEGNDVAVGEVGEIVVHGVPGRSIMLGYYRDEAATAAAMRDGWLHTGDKAYADAEGYLYFFDRKKDVIKRAGENVSAVEVETVLLDHPAVADAAVVGVPDAIRDEAVAAVIVLEADAAASADDLTAHCAERLARFKVPTIIAFRDALPKTSIGKVQKGELRRDMAGDAEQHGSTVSTER